MSRVPIFPAQLVLRAPLRPALRQAALRQVLHRVGPLPLARVRQVALRPRQARPQQARARLEPLLELQARQVLLPQARALPLALRPVPHQALVPPHRSPARIDSSIGSRS